MYTARTGIPTYSHENAIDFLSGFSHTATSPNEWGPFARHPFFRIPQSGAAMRPSDLLTQATPPAVVVVEAFVAVKPQKTDALRRASHTFVHRSCEAIRRTAPEDVDRIVTPDTLAVHALAALREFLDNHYGPDIYHDLGVQTEQAGKLIVAHATQIFMDSPQP